MEQKTLIELFYQQERENPDRPFLRQPFGDRWEVYTVHETGQMARKMANGLLKLGLPPKSHIGLVSKNCREWIIADLAIMMAGHVSVPFFPTLTGDQLKQVIELGDVAAIFIGKMEVWDDMQKGVPDGMPVIAFPHYEGNDKIELGQPWKEVLANNEPLQGEYVPSYEDIWTIVFTSGTTGTPKGVMLNYGNLSSLLEMVTDDEGNPLELSREGDNEFFSYLPLNHIAERAIVESCAITFGGQISFVESLETFGKNLAETRPTVFFAVPRIWTKFQMGILEKMPQKKLDLFLKIPILKGIVKKKIISGLGLDRARANVSGAAPITQEMKNWFRRLGIPISEGYGMTENCASCTFLTPAEDKPGSVGKAGKGSEIKIDENTGEILMRGAHVMQGYYKSPEKTEEVIRDGWLHTGDQGHIDEEGYLYITGRVKDTFKTAKGKYIVPSPIEFKFAGNTDIEQICLLGLGMPQPMAIVVPSELGQKKAAEELKSSLSESLTQANQELPNYQKISTLVVTNEPFSVENGLLTPTLKVKRPAVNQKYKSQLQGWHNAAESVIFD